MDFKKTLMSSAVAAALCSTLSAQVLAVPVPASGYVINAGEIVEAENGEYAGLHISAGDVVNGNIDNSGTVAGVPVSEPVLDYDGLAIEGSLNGNITNRSGGVFLGEEGIDIDGAGLTGRIINEQGGLITGMTGILIDGSADGISNPDPFNSDFIAIQNSGLIQSTGLNDDEYYSGSAILIVKPVNGDLVNLPGGVIRSLHGDGIRIVGQNEQLENQAFLPDTLNGVLDNGGTILGGRSGIYIDSGNIDADIQNRVTGYIYGEEVGITVGGRGVSGIENNGTIEGGDVGLYLDAVDTESVIDNSILNSGTIRATSFDGVAILVRDAIGTGSLGPNDGDEVYGLINEEGGLIESTSGAAIWLAEEDSEIHGQFLNKGTIRGIYAVDIYSEEDFIHPAQLLENTQTGFLDGRVHGSQLTLRNDGTFRTEQGSLLDNYAGSGKIIAVVSESTDQEYSILRVLDTATLEAGSSVLVEGKLNDFTATADGNEYVIIAADTLQIEDGLEVGSTSNLLDVTLASTEDNKLTVLVKAEDLGEEAAESGATEEEQTVVQTLQQEVLRNLPDSDPLAPLVQQALNSTDPNALADLARALQPETSGSDSAGAAAVQSAAFGSIINRASSNRTGTSTGDMFESGGVWGQLLYSQGKQKDKSDSNGFDSRVSGLTLGTDVDLNNMWTVGAALTAAKGETKSNNSGNTTDTDSVIGTVYGSWSHGALYADVMASVGRSSNEGERLGKLISSDYDVDQYGLRLTVGQDILFGAQDILLQPNVSFNYGRVDIEAYEEKGSQAAQYVEKQRYETVELGAGITAIKSYEMQDGVLQATAELNGWHDFAADRVKTQSRFVSGDTIITSTGTDPEKTTWQAGIGVNYLAGNNFTASLTYDHTWKSGFKADSISAKVRYDF